LTFTRPIRRKISREVETDLDHDHRNLLYRLLCLKETVQEEIEYIEEIVPAEESAAPYDDSSIQDSYSSEPSGTDKRSDRSIWDDHDKWRQEELNRSR